MRSFFDLVVILPHLKLGGDLAIGAKQFSRIQASANAK